MTRVALNDDGVKQSKLQILRVANIFYQERSHKSINQSINHQSDGNKPTTLLRPSQ
jgi:hypothetical protein